MELKSGCPVFIRINNQLIGREGQSVSALSDAGMYSVQLNDGGLSKGSIVRFVAMDDNAGLQVYLGRSGPRQFKLFALGAPETDWIIQKETLAINSLHVGALVHLTPAAPIYVCDGFSGQCRTTVGRDNLELELHCTRQHCRVEFGQIAFMQAGQCEERCATKPSQDVSELLTFDQLF